MLTLGPLIGTLAANLARPIPSPRLQVGSPVWPIYCQADIWGGQHIPTKILRQLSGMRLAEVGYTSRQTVMLGDVLNVQMGREAGASSASIRLQSIPYVTHGESKKRLMDVRTAENE